MKKFLLSLFSLVMLTGISQLAQAQDYSITFEWDIPGSVALKVGSTMQDIPADATSHTVITTDKWASITVSGASGYDFVSWIDPKNDAVKTSPYVSMSTYNGTTIHVNVEKIVYDASFNLKITNGLSSLTTVKLTGTDTNLLGTLQEGDNAVPYRTAKDSQIDIQTAYGSSIFYVKKDGETLSPRFASMPNSYRVDLADGANIEVAVFDPAEASSDVELTLDIPKGLEGCINNVRDWTKSAFIQDNIKDGKLVVAPGTDLQFNLNVKDYTFSAIEYNGTALDLKGSSKNYVRFVANESGTLKFNVAEKDYGTRTITAYVVNPEGINLIAGNGLDGVSLELKDGETVNEPIELLECKDAGTVIDGAYTIPAGAARKFTLTYSLRYNGIMVTDKEGYYITHTRGEDRKSELVSGCSDLTVYIVAESTAPDSKAWIYYEGPTDRVRVSSSSKYGASRNVYLAPGYNEYNFNLNYESPVSLRYGEKIEGMEVYLNGEKLSKRTESQTEYEIYDVNIKDGSFVRIFADGNTHQTAKVNFITNGDAAAEVTYDKVLKHDIANGALMAYPGTEIAIKPGEGTSVAVDGNNVALDNDGKYVFTTTGAHAVTLSKEALPYQGPYALNPESGTEVTSLETIVVSFPEAKSATWVEGTEDEMMLVCGNSYAAWGFDVVKLENYEFPAFEITPKMTPGVDGVYNFNIPAGFFTVDGLASKSISAIYGLTLPSGELEYTFDPVGDTFAGEWYTFTVIFNEGKYVSMANDFADKCKLTFNGQELTYEADYMAGGEGNNMFMFMVSNEAYFNKTGVFTLELAEGALSVSGEPSPAMSNSWNIIEPVKYTVQFLTDASSSQPTLNTIRIAIPEAKTAEVYRNSGIVLMDDNYNYRQSPAEVKAVEGAEYPTFDLIFNPAPTVDGKYTLSISWMAFALDGTQTLPQDFEQTYTLDSRTGVEDIIAGDQNGNGEIFNLQGIRLNSEWNELPAGIYIINGKKVKKNF